MGRNLSNEINDAAARKLPLSSWLEKIAVKASNKKIEDYGFGKGKTEALNLTLQIPESGVILDDFAARKCAKDLKIPFIGTGGLLISAKQKGLISSVSEALKKVQEEGLWLSDAIIKLLKEKAGE